MGEAVELAAVVLADVLAVEPTGLNGMPFQYKVNELSKYYWENVVGCYVCFCISVSLL